MEIEYADLPAATKVITTKDLSIPKASDFAKCLSFIGNCELIECRQIDDGEIGLFKKGDEIVIFDTAVQVGQKPVQDIRFTERIAILFFKSDQIIPLVFALRTSFPVVLHRINMPFECPKCLCIYEMAYDDLKLDWRPQQFLQDIREWLARTADDKLHQDDQPLEAFILSTEGTLLVPNDLKSDEKVFVLEISKNNGLSNLMVTRNGHPPLKPFVFIFMVGEAQDHGVLNTTPNNIFALSEFLLKAGIDLIANIQKRLRENPLGDQFLISNLLLLIQFPKKAKNRTVIENDLYAFASIDNIKTIGLTLNVWEDGPNGLGQVILADKPENENIKLLNIKVYTPHRMTSKESAKLLSGYDDPKNTEISIAQIGVGALGSQLFVNLRKTGFGQWNLIDQDILLPHNIVRHHLGPDYLGWSKAWALTRESCAFFGPTNFVNGIWDNYMQPADKKTLDDALGNADVILDVSTSIPVARDLAYRKNLKGRRISMFLNPMGTDLVVLSEDYSRKITLDILEFQYYRSLIEYPSLHTHLQSSSAIRYSTSCRDITSRISQDDVALHAAIASTKLKKLTKSNAAEIGIWQRGNEMEVKKIEIPIAEFKINQYGEWAVYIDRALIDKLNNARNERLPNETGGILIGGYDIAHKRIYILETILSPEDSEEKPNSYIRGIKGVREKLEIIRNQTANHLMYIGEWHSHPKRCSVQMSKYDIILFKEIEKEMQVIGYPALMIIIGDNAKFKIYMEL